MIPLTEFTQDCVKSFFVAFLSCAGILLIWGEVHACSFKRVPLADFDDNEFIFIGTVVGYTEPISIPGRKGTKPYTMGEPGSWYHAHGLKVRVLEGLKRVIPLTDEVEVFSYLHNSVCAPLGFTKELLDRQFPLNTRVIVIGQTATILPSGTKSGITRLEIRPAKGLIDKISEIEPAFQPTATSVFDYKSASETRGSLWSVSVFEARKDLMRLRDSSNYSEKEKIFERLIHFKGGWRLIDYYVLLRKHLRTVQEVNNYYLRMLEFSEIDKKVIDTHLRCLEEKVRYSQLRPGESRC